MRASARHTPPLAATPRDDEDLFGYLQRTIGGFDRARYLQLLGAANAFKEGDHAIGVAAADDQERLLARTLLAATRLEEIDAHPIIADDLHALLRVDLDDRARQQSATWTMGQLRDVLLTHDGASITALARGLSSDVIGCVVKLMSDDDLRAVTTVREMVADGDVRGDADTEGEGLAELKRLGDTNVEGERSSRHTEATRIVGEARGRRRQEDDGFGA